MAGIVSWGVYIPKYRISIGTLSRVHGSTKEDIEKNLMIKEKAVAGIDEDVVTMIVEAARNMHINTKNIGALYIGSETPPYTVKPTGTIVAEALSLDNNYTTADIEFACKSGTASIQICLSMVDSKQVSLAIAGGADKAKVRPKSVLEYTAASAAAVFLIGKEEVCAVVNGNVSFTSDTPDFWRKSHSKFPEHGGGFTGEPAYYHHVMNSSINLMRKMKSSPSDYDYAVFHQPNGKFPLRVAKKLRFSEDQLEQGMIVSRIGNPYSASSMIGLASVLDVAKPGERIFLTSYGSGAGSDSFDITVTNNILSMQKKIKPVSLFFTETEHIDYPTYLNYSGVL